MISALPSCLSCAHELAKGLQTTTENPDEEGHFYLFTSARQASSLPRCMLSTTSVPSFRFPSPKALPSSFHFLILLILDNRISRKPLLIFSTDLQTGTRHETVYLFLPFFSILLYSCLIRQGPSGLPLLLYHHSQWALPLHPPLPIPS